MAGSRKSFCIICMANYCRSPVAENILRNKFGHKYEFFSAGIAPITQPNMDLRSLKFLNDNNIKHTFHTPKKINKKMLNYFDKFLAVDSYILNRLNLNYPKYKHKFCSITSQFSDMNIFDPYQLKHDEYLKIMNNIKFVSENINLEVI